MMKEIGSEFWIDRMPDHKCENKPDWLKKFGNILLTSSGRGAISALLGEVHTKNKTALLPAYICDSVILPFLEHGYTCYYYDINTDMTPDIEDIESFMGIGIFLHMGYYGFSTNKNLFSILERFKTDSTIIVEDITHTLYSDITRFDENDYYVASLRKWMGLPSGGFLASKTKLNVLLKKDNTLANIRKEALQIKALYMESKDISLKKKYLELFNKGEEILDINLTPYEIDDTSKYIIDVFDRNQLIETRKRNYCILDNGMKEMDAIQPVFNNISDSICPLFYPVYISTNRDNIRNKLIAQNIYCPIHWPIPNQITSSIEKYRHTKVIYSSVLSIPCDQRYNEIDMKMIIGVVKRIVN